MELAARLPPELYEYVFSFLETRILAAEDLRRWEAELAARQHCYTDLTLFATRDLLLDDPILRGRLRELFYGGRHSRLFFFISTQPPAPRYPLPDSPFVSANW